MLRKLSLVAVAAASLGAAALAPTSASAWGGRLAHGGWHRTVGAGVAPASSSAAPPITAAAMAAAMCGDLVGDPLGPPLAAGEPLLLISPDPLRLQMPRPLRPGLSVRSTVEPIAGSCSSSCKHARSMQTGNNSGAGTWCRNIVIDLRNGTRTCENCHEQPNQPRHRTDRSQDHASRSAMPSANGCSRTCGPDTRGSRPTCSI